MARSWFAYDTVNDPFHPASYRRQNSTPGCINGPVICSIYALGTAERPTLISINLRRYIADGLANNIAEPATPAGSKFFVYMKALA